ncbi:hypothetical protein OF83DRAFT_1228509, partial [Amylostereum chailletii]
IVLWRAWILWSRNRVLQVISVASVLATLGLSLADISDACTTFDGSVFEGSPIGLAALTMSLVTNLWATTLIGYKAWMHRRLIRKHIQSGDGKTQVEKVMTLLVESGVLYCCVWVRPLPFVSQSNLIGTPADPPGCVQLHSGCRGLWGHRAQPPPQLPTRKLHPRHRQVH